MVQADLVLDKEGLLRSCRVLGHAGAGSNGYDVVCAAVSVLTRTIVKVLSGREGLTIRGCIPERGNFQMEVDYAEEGKEFLNAAGAFLYEGLKSVAAEFPKNCVVNVKRRN